MEREIKFRGKNKIGWIYGVLSYPNIKNKRIPCIYDGYAECIVNTDTIGQFTEMHDIKLREIYEDDIVKVKYGDAIIICIVKWNKDVGAWCLLIKGDTQIGVKPLDRFLCDIECKIEVIGNIYDNKELLEE